MLNLSEFSLAVSVQIAMVLLMLIVYLAYLIRDKNKKIDVLKASVKDYKEVSPSFSVENYLSEEIKSIASRVDTLSSSKSSQSEDFSEADFLELRKSVLEIEKELLLNKNSAESFWTDMGDKIKNALSFNYLKKPNVEKKVEEDSNYKKNNFNSIGDETT